MQAWPDADWDKAHKHGVTAYGVTSWLPYASVDEALEGLMNWHLITRQNENVITIEDTEDIQTADQENKAALLLASQDGTFIEDKLHRIEAFYRLGLRLLIPTYNRNNNICGGCNDKFDSGLTRFGLRVVEECNRVGLLLDCSHLGKQSSLEIIEQSDDPVVFSHSNAKEIVDSYRNIDDEQIKACADNGGVIGLAPFAPFTQKDESNEWPTIEDFIDHINHVVDITGSTEHIGIGTDMSLGSYPLSPDHKSKPWGEPDYTDDSYEERDQPLAYKEDLAVDSEIDARSPELALQDFNSYPQVTNLIQALENEGYDENDIRNILGGNYMRIFNDVWK